MAKTIPGPMSKSAVESNGTFTIKKKESLTTSPKGLSNSSEEAHRIIKSIRVKPASYSGNVEAGLKSKKAPR